MDESGFTAWYAQRHGPMFAALLVSGTTDMPVGRGFTRPFTPDDAAIWADALSG